MGKICYTCKEEKDISLFKKDAKSKDGHCYKCKACCSVADPELKKLKESKELLLAKGIKTCNACKEEKPIEEFLLKRNGKYHSWCNDCRKLKKKEWDFKNEDHIIEYKKKTEEHRIKKDIEYRESHRKELRLQASVYNEKMRDYRKQQRLKPENRQREKERGRKWRAENKEHTSIYFKEYYAKDDSKRIGRNLRHRLHKILKGTNSALHTKDIAGCSLEFLKHHIESQFTEAMSWENYPTWHVDHIIPCNAFDLTNPIHQRACFYWKNLQPLGGAENISKNDNYNIEDFNNYMAWFMENVINK